jgi:hypothetical protein
MPANRAKIGEKGPESIEIGLSRPFLPLPAPPEAVFSGKSPYIGQGIFPWRENFLFGRTREKLPPFGLRTSGIGKSQAPGGPPMGYP